MVYNEVEMRLIARKRIVDFYSIPEYRDSKKALEAWIYETKYANWKAPSDIKEKYGNASILLNNRVVFNICGNKYRIVVSVNYSTGILYLRFIGTHAEYDQIDAEVY
jgi:mRNA interferase HigB